LNARFQRVYHSLLQCQLFIFSGTDDIQEYVLEQSVTGWRNILRVIDYSFHGGTDVGGVLLHALAKLQQTQWQDADVCLISDGRFVADTVVECPMVMLLACTDCMSVAGTPGKWNDYVSRYIIWKICGGMHELPMCQSFLHYA
jgi:hypothetical protein